MSTPQLECLSTHCQRLHAVGADLNTLLEQAAKDLSYADFLDDVLALELRVKREKDCAMRVASRLLEATARAPVEESRWRAAYAG